MTGVQPQTPLKLETTLTPREEEALVLKHMPMIQRVARWMLRRIPTNVNLGDLEAAGVIGLLQAVRNQDPERSDSFVSYARRRVEYAMFDELRRQDVLPKDARQLSRRILAAMERVQQRKGDADEESVAAELGVTVDQYRWMLEHTVDVRLESFELHQRQDENRSEFHDDSPNALETLMDGELCERLADALRCLPQRHRRVLALYYLEDMNMKEISLAMNMAHSRASQLHAEAVHRLRVHLRLEDRADAVVETVSAATKPASPLTERSV